MRLTMQFHNDSKHIDLDFSFDTLEIKVMDLDRTTKYAKFPLWNRVGDGRYSDYYRFLIKDECEYYIIITKPEYLTVEAKVLLKEYFPRWRQMV